MLRGYFQASHFPSLRVVASLELVSANQEEACQVLYILSFLNIALCHDVFFFFLNDHVFTSPCSELLFYSDLVQLFHLPLVSFLDVTCHLCLLLLFLFLFTGS